MAAKPPPYKRPVLPWERKRDPGLGWMRWTSLGLEFGLAVGLFLLGGRWLDATLGWTPWGTMLGALLGVAAGMGLLIRAALRPPPASSDQDDPPPASP
jgi:hypothetical protein